MVVCLAVARLAWLGWDLVDYFLQMGMENHSSPLVGAPFIVHRRFSVRKSICWLEDPDH